MTSFMIFKGLRRDLITLFVPQIEDFKPFNDLPFLLTSQVNLLKNFHMTSLFVRPKIENHEL